MKSARKRRPGYERTNWGYRHVDIWREWAEVPLPSFEVISPERPGGSGNFDPVYTLKEDGVVVGTWRNSDAPWLRLWITRRLAQLHGAWHIAREQLAIVEGQVDAGNRRARELKRKAAVNDAKAVKAAKEILSSEGPMNGTDLADRVADRLGRGKFALRTKLPKLLDN